MDGLSAQQLDRFEALLECSDPDLMAWISGAEPVPPDCDHDVMKLLKNIKITISRH
jgi:antitoxin CptB